MRYMLACGPDGVEGALFLNAEGGLRFLSKSGERTFWTDVCLTVLRNDADGARWEVNRMHEDYLALKAEGRARLRYLLALLAKDLAQHAHRVPGAVEASEDVVAILALAERNLRGA